MATGRASSASEDEMVVAHGGLKDRAFETCIYINQVTLASPANPWRAHCPHSVRLLAVSKEFDVDPHFARLAWYRGVVDRSYWCRWRQPPSVNVEVT
jgi:hypothetical protein